MRRRGPSVTDLILAVGLGLLLLFAVGLVVAIGMMFWYGVPGA